jgi:hypothetical protein
MQTLRIVEKMSFMDLKLKRKDISSNKSFDEFVYIFFSCRFED